MWRNTLLVLFLASTCYGLSITFLSGCTDMSSGRETINCSPFGGDRITLQGDYTGMLGHELYMSIWFGTSSGGIACTSPEVVSVTVVKCTLGSGNGYDLQPYIYDSLLSTRIDPINQFVLLSMGTGGYQMSREGVGIHTNFAAPGAEMGFRDVISGQGTYQYFSGINSLPGVVTQGALNSNHWRVGGLYGSTDCGNKVPSSNSFYVGRCSTEFGAANSKTLGIAGPWTLTPILPSRSEIYRSASNQGGFLSWRYLTTDVLGSLGFIPYYRGTTNNDLIPGYLDLRLTNKMAQTINSLSVRYTLQCANLFENSTTVQLQYTQSGAQNWYYNPVLGSEYTSPGSCISDNNCQCSEAGFSCWNKYQTFRHLEISGLNWLADEYFYLRWYITSDAKSAGLFGDPCRILDLEVIPYISNPGSSSLQIRQKGYNYVDVNSTAGPLWFQNEQPFTISSFIRPNSRGDGLDSIPRTINSDDMVIFSFWDGASDWNLALTNYSTGSWLLSIKSYYPVSSVIYSSGVMIPSDTWTHVAVTHSGTGFRHVFEIYVDGVLKATSPDMWSGDFGGNNANARFRIGQVGFSNGANGRSFIGHIDDFKVWNYRRAALDISSDLDIIAPTLTDSRLLVYLTFDRMVNGLIPNSKFGSQLIGQIKNSTTSALSPLIAPILYTYTGGSITCYEKVTIPNGVVRCNFTIMTQFGVAKSVYDRSQFYVKLIEGGGTIGPLDPDYTGSVWRFSYFASNITGTARFQAYSKGGNSFSGNPFRVSVIPEVCRSCTYLEKRGNVKIYSCTSAGKHFIRADVGNAATSTCPAV